MALLIGLRNGFPQTTTRLFTAIAYCIRDHLTRLSAESYPNPGLIRLLQYKRPQFVQFQDRRLCIIHIRWDQRFAQGRQLCGLFLSRRSPRYVTLQRSALALANCFALHKLSESLLDVLLGRHVVSGFHGFASGMLYSDSSVFHWVLDRSAPPGHFRNGDKIQ